MCVRHSTYIVQGADTCATVLHACKRFRALLTPSEKVGADLSRAFVEKASGEEGLARERTGTGAEIFGSRLRLSGRLELSESN